MRYNQTRLISQKHPVAISHVILHSGIIYVCQLYLHIKSCTMMMSSNGNLFRVTDPLCGEFTGHRWIPHTKASDAEFWCFLWSVSWINGWVNNSKAGDLRRKRAHYDVIVMRIVYCLHDYAIFPNEPHTITRDRWNNISLFNTGSSYCGWQDNYLYLRWLVSPFKLVLRTSIHRMYIFSEISPLRAELTWKRVSTNMALSLSTGY